MKYQRWYPSAVTLPNGMVLILSGTDSDDGDRGTRNQTTVPEVYDPVLQTVVALENARKALAGEYPLAYVVQTGPGENDWVVAVSGEVEAGELSCNDVPPFTNVCPSPIPSKVDRERDTTGQTFYLDVLAALAADTTMAGENHWEGPIATPQKPHLRAGTAQIWELKGNGTAKSMKVVGFGGSDADATVAMIDYADANPQWVEQDPLYKDARDNDAAVGPDGHVLIVGGDGGDGISLHYQSFNPKSGKMKLLDWKPIRLGDHTTLLLLPDASYLVMGSDRVRLLRDVVLDVTGDGVDGDPDLGVPVAHRYKPPYLFWGERPVIEDAPEVIGYGSSFEVDVSGKGKAKKIKSVVLIRPSPKTHKWDWGNRYIKLPFEQKKSMLTVKAPAVPGLAVPGNYMLFVVNKDGVPGVAELVKLQ